jgi:uncharacterized protein YdhG (YjbR/CyaY superfamily)
VKEDKRIPVSIYEYIAAFPVAVQELLRLVRDTIRQAAPEAGEKISYRIPTFTLHGNLIHFAAFKNHIGLYPGSEAIEAFREELLDYRTAKGTIQFPLDRPIPVALIAKIVEYRVKESLNSVKSGKSPSGSSGT